MAAARLGANVTIIGCVGDDAFGTELVTILDKEGIDTRYIQIAQGVSSGVATITLNQSENTIVVIPGANHMLSPRHLESTREAFRTADVVLCQLEIPLPTVEAAAAISAEFDKTIATNPAQLRSSFTLLKYCVLTK